MIKDLINIELKDLPMEGLDVQIIKKYLVKTASDDSFITRNYSVILIRSGRFKIRLKDITQELGTHDMVVIPKNAYCTLLEVKGQLQLFLISFSSDFALGSYLKKELIDSFIFLLGEPSRKITLEQKDYLVLCLIYKLIYFICQDSRQNSGDLELQRMGFNLFLFELKSIFNKYTSEEAPSIGRKESLSIQFLTILTIHCKKQHSAGFYAGALFVTPGYLNKTVKQVTGKTVKHLISQAMISEIKALLENSQVSITCIAEEFEFSSLSKFSEFFKRHTAVSPSRYRSSKNKGFKSRQAYDQ